jgi:hypothetical protein
MLSSISLAIIMAARRKVEAGDFDSDSGPKTPPYVDIQDGIFDDNYDITAPSRHLSSPPLSPRSMPAASTQNPRRRGGVGPSARSVHGSSTDEKADSSDDDGDSDPPADPSSSSEDESGIATEEKKPDENGAEEGPEPKANKKPKRRKSKDKETTKNGQSTAGKKRAKASAKPTGNIQATVVTAKGPVRSARGRATVPRTLLRNVSSGQPPAGPLTGRVLRSTCLSFYFLLQRNLEGNWILTAMAS